MEPVMGVVLCFAGTFVPRYWASCDGQTLRISDNPALFSLLGTTYGGDGIITFNLPDLRGRTVVSAGKSVLNSYKLGESAGKESVQLNMTHLPVHDHNGNISLQLAAASDPGIDPTVNDGYPSQYSGAYSDSADSAMLPPDYTNVAMGNTGAGVPVDTRSPFLVLTYIIALKGIYPSKP
jgi:microcystin-dependent protein